MTTRRSADSERPDPGRITSDVFARIHQDTTHQPGAPLRKRSMGNPAVDLNRKFVTNAPTSVEPEDNAPWSLFPGLRATWRKGPTIKRPGNSDKG